MPPVRPYSLPFFWCTLNLYIGTCYATGTCIRFYDVRLFAIYNQHAIRLYNTVIVKKLTKS